MAATSSNTVRAGRLLRLLGWMTLGLGLIAVVLFPNRPSIGGSKQISDISLLAIFVAYAITCHLIGAALIRGGKFAKLSGTVLAIVSLPLFPLGTLCGAAALVYVARDRHS